jgi:hypothetical protein
MRLTGTDGLCDGYLERPVMFKIWDWDKTSEDDVVGSVVTVGMRACIKMRLNRDASVKS